MESCVRTNAALPTGLLLALLALFGAACSGTPTQTAPRPLDAPVRSLGRFYDLFVSPEAVGRDLASMRERTESLVAAETDVRKPFDSAGQVLARESDRLDDAPRSAVALVDREGDRLGDLRNSRGFTALDPSTDLADLGDDLRHLPRTLRLDRPMMGESDDRRHRTDPDDDRPEASFGPRLWRRLFP